MNTQTAITELVNVAYHQHGGIGDAGARVLKAKKIERCPCGNKLERGDIYESQLRHLRVAVCRVCWSKSKRRLSFIGARHRTIKILRED